MFPFPNNFWLGQDGKLALTNETFPKDNLGGGIDVTAWNTLDGFSPLGALYTYIPNLSLDGFPRLWEIGASLSSDGPTLLLNTETNEAVPHWTELDFASGGPPAEQALLVWPAYRLNTSTRYMFAIRNATTMEGRRVRAPEATRELLLGEGNAGAHSLEQRARYKRIGMELQNAGWDLGSVVQTWDFTVGSRKEITGGFVAMRDDALSRVPHGGVDYKITSTLDNPAPGVRRYIYGQMRVPWYLNQLGAGTGVRLVLNETTGLPRFQQMASVNFTITVPDSLVDDSTQTSKRGRIVQYGHGLFGSQHEVQDAYLQAEANANDYVYIAVDWLGLCQQDEVAVALMIGTSFNNFPMIPDRLHQGMLNALYAMRMMMTSVYKDPVLTFYGNSVVDPTQRHYYGNSLGGIYGSVYMSVSTDVTTGVLGVAGAPFSILLPRSIDFADLFLVMKLRYSSTLDRIGLMPVMQLLWDRMSPGGFIDGISGTPLPGTPTHRVAIHYGLGDAQVTWLGGQTLGRTVGASMFESQAVEGNVTLFGFPRVPDAANVTSGNVIQGFEFDGIPQVPFTDVPPAKYDTHEDPRRTIQAQNQTGRFFEQGGIQNFCGSECILPVPSR